MNDWRNEVIDFSRIFSDKFREGAEPLSALTATVHIQSPARSPLIFPYHHNVETLGDEMLVEHASDIEALLADPELDATLMAIEPPRLIPAIAEAMPDTPEPKPASPKKRPPRLIPAIAEQELSPTDFLDYLNLETIATLRPPLADLEAMIGARAPPLLSLFREAAPRLVRAMDSFITQLLLEAVILDKGASRIARHRHDLMGLIEGERGAYSNERNLAAVEAMMARQCAQAHDPEAEDPLYETFTTPAKRGRKSADAKCFQSNRLELMIAEMVHKQKAMSGRGQNRTPPVDLYPMLVRLIDAMHRSTASPRDNHGWFLQHTRTALALTPAHWPAQRLMRALANAEYIAPLKRQVVLFDARATQHYCAFTGEPLRNGERVWCLRVVEHDARRFAEWRDVTQLPRETLEREEWKGALSAFFVKESALGVTSLFHTAAKRETPPLAAPVQALLRGIARLGDGEFLWHRGEYRWAQEHASLLARLGAMTQSSARDDWRKIVYYYFGKKTATDALIDLGDFVRLACPVATHTRPAAASLLSVSAAGPNRFTSITDKMALAAQPSFHAAPFAFLLLYEHLCGAPPPLEGEDFKSVKQALVALDIALRLDLCDDEI
jgi:hypothetical protein